MSFVFREFAAQHSDHLPKAQHHFNFSHQGHLKPATLKTHRNESTENNEEQFPLLLPITRCPPTSFQIAPPWMSARRPLLPDRTTAPLRHQSRCRAEPQWLLPSKS